jgi:AraC-like DNA-binding protein
MDFTLWDILILVSLGQGMAFGLAVLLSKSFRNRSNNQLAYSIIMISVIGFNDWLSGWNFDDQYYFIDFFGDDLPWILLFYVPMFFYFLSKGEHPLKEDKRLYWLVTPFLLFSILNIVINLDVDFHYYRIPNVEEFQIIVYAAESYLALLYSVILCAISYPVILKSEAGQAIKNWLISIWLFSAILISLWLIVELVNHYPWWYKFMNYFIWLCISLFFYWLIFRGIYQLQLKQSNEPKKQVGGSLAREVVIFEKLQQVMQEEQLYKNPDLSRDQVASVLGISPGYLSQIVNSVTDSNFTHYINSLRVKEVQQMLLDTSYEQYSFWALGMEAGFKSKSTFYAVFKKITGMTPSEFQKSSAKES